MKKITTFKFKAFTFIELIIVITILAILWTIGFISYSWYIWQSRDSNRISQISSIYNALEWYKLKGTLPLPENKIAIYASGELIWYQWYVWEDVLNKIWFQEWWKDPETSTYFTYYVDFKLRNTELLIFFEDESTVSYNKNNKFNLWVSKANASDNSWKIPRPYGDKMWIILSPDNLPIQEDLSLVWIWLDVVTTNLTLQALFSIEESISWTWNVLKVVYWTTKTWIIWSSCQDYIDANGWYFLNPWDYLFSSSTGWLTTWYCNMN